MLLDYLEYRAYDGNIYTIHIGDYVEEVESPIFTTRKYKGFVTNIKTDGDRYIINLTVTSSDITPRFGLLTARPEWYKKVPMANLS